MGRPTITLRTFLVKEWLPAIESTVRHSTFVAYEIQVRRHIVPKLGRLQLRAVSGRALNTFYATLLKGHGGHLSPSTVRRVHACLHRAFRDAVRWGYLDVNPADSCDPPRDRGRNTEMKTWSPQELAAFLEHVSKDRLYPMWVLLATTGMRRGEVLGLRWVDVDLESRTIAVRQTLLRVGAEIRFSTPKSARGRRVIAIDRHSTKVLKRFRSKLKAPSSESLLFTRTDGSLINPCQVTRVFNRLIAEIGLPRIRLHDLRHTHATIALLAGVHPKIVSERLGHSTIALTLDVYSHAIPHMQKDAAEKIARLIFS